MGLVDLLSWLSDVFSPSREEFDVGERERDLAARARSDSLAPEDLALPADRTSSPPVSYLEDDERPQYLFRGGRLLVADDEGSVSREYPTLELAVLVSDARLLFVLGGRLADDVFEVPLADVDSTYLDEEDAYRYLVVEATRDGDPMTFYADVTIEPAAREVDAGVEYVRARASGDGGDREPDTDGADDGSDTDAADEVTVETDDDRRTDARDA